MARTRNHGKTAFLLALAACLLGAFAFPLGGAPPRKQGPALDRVGSEIDRVGSELRDSALSDRGDLEELLRRARSETKSGRLWTGLEALGRAERAVRAASRASRAPRAAAEFEREWNEARAAIPRRLEASRRRLSPDAPAELRALVEAADSEARTLVSSSRAYAAVTDAGSGAYYLGQAEGAAAFAEFCAALPAARAGEPLPLRSFSEDLTALQRRVVAAFQPPRSIDLHPRFIRLNATLKLAGELDAAGSKAGALSQYLEGLLQFRAIEPSVRPEGPDALRTALSEMRGGLERSPRDESIALSFVEKAESLLAGGAVAAPGSQKAAPESQAAAEIVHDVLPTYRAAVDRNAPAAMLGMSDSRFVPKSGVTVTLVRWPYT